MSDVSSLDTATRGHHPDSPSSLQASEACPAFQNEQRESQASTDGTLQHKAAETRDLSILHGDEAMEWAVKKCLEYEDAAINEFRLANLPFEIVKEVKVTVGDDAVTEGFPDLIIVGEIHGVGLDWKFGKEPVTPTKSNLQAIAYVLGIFRRYPKLKTITFHFFAPYQKWSAQEQREKYVHTFHRDEVEKLELRVRVVIARKHVAYAEVAQGNWQSAAPKHNLCLWCARKGVCPKVGALVVQTTSKYHDLEVPEVVKEYRLTTPDQVAVAYRFVSQLGPIIEAIKKRCIDAAVTEDLLPPNFKIVTSQRRTVKDAVAFLKVAVEQGIPEEEAVRMLKVSFEPFEDFLKKTAARGQGAARIRAFNAALEEGGVTELGSPFHFLREVKTPAEKQSVIDV